MRERLLRESDHSLLKTDEICRAVGDNSGVAVSAVKTNTEDHQKSSQDKRKMSKRTSSDGKRAQEWWNCGRKHEFHKREL